MKSHHPMRPQLRLVGEPEDFHHGAWRSGRLLVIAPHATLPDRCVVCNAPAEGHTLHKTLYWHTPLLLALLAINPLIYAVLAVIFKRSMPAELPLCARHLLRRRVLGVLGVVLLPAFPILAGLGIMLSMPKLLLPGLIASLVGIAVLLLGRNEVWAYRITEEHTFIWGADATWLEALPPWEQS